MTTLLAIGALWAGVAITTTTALFLAIHHTKHTSPTFTDNELLAARTLKDTTHNGPQIIQIEGPHHRLLINGNQHAASRIIRGRRTELQWPTILNQG